MTSNSRRWQLASALALSLGLASCDRAARDQPFIRGVTVSSQTWGQEWGTPAMASALDELKSLGVGSIAIHPYARIQADGGLDFPADAAQPYITRPLQWARERGLGVMVVPHIGYWGTPFLWRGDIDFQSPAEWDRFFREYENWIVPLARLAEQEQAGIFCIGLEYSQAVKYDERWRQIIQAVRAVYHGKLTYGANWDTYADVPFWDALDYVGVLAYFPLSRNPMPTVGDLADGWKRWMPQLEEFSRREGKPLLFTEIGYNESTRTAAKPWDFQEPPSGDARLVQARCIETALVLERNYPCLAGMFWWKWFPEVPGEGRETFDLRRPFIKRLLRQYWGGA